MNIEYQDAGSEARLIITSSLFGWRSHRKLVNAILSEVPQLGVSEENGLMLNTMLYGPVAYVLCAEIVVEEMGYQVWEAE
ncbi:hypothetical protein DO659_03170 [Salmonella enterica subsp. enterica serovar Minnesota]|nr:hypothetical protein [Salmonella enterica subsp. enterica serovar Minnesota]